MQPESIAQYRHQARILKGLANETRLAILHCLADGECYVNELAERLGVDQPRISGHLAILRAQGIVSQKRDGMHTRYSSNTPCALKLCDCMRDMCDRCRNVVQSHESRSTGDSK